MLSAIMVIRSRKGEPSTLNDFEALKIALGKIEGTRDKNRMVRSAIYNSLEGPIRKLAQELSDDLKEDQRERGIYHPLCGELTAAEIIFWAWLSSRKEEDDG